MRAVKRVVVAMSGGVDSSVSAVLLLEQGYEVIGVNMRFGDQDPITADACCSLESSEDARRVARQLGIPFYVVNYDREFREKVVKYFCEEYLSGRTPNPCIICNQEMKFGKLLQLAKSLDAYIATGHYARVLFDENAGRFLLMKGVDKRRDQSYFLFSLKQEQLSRLLLPLGNYTKNEVREIAKKHSLSVAEKPGSQDICFIPDHDHNRFLMEQLKDRIQPGPIVDKKGNVVGEHDGIVFYTIGQRKGLGDNLGKPMYVISIDKPSNTIVVGSKKDLYAKGLKADKANFISIPKLTEPIRAKVKLRYVDIERDSTIIPGEDEDSFEVIFDHPSMSVTPGQAVVLYDNDIVIGGGWIKESQT